MKIYRQGDVMIVEVKSVPKGAKVQKQKGDIILAHGEVTGHAHRIAAPAVHAKMWDAKAERFLQVMETVALTHEEHSTVNLPAGVYHISIQTEYTPQELRNVQD